MTGFYKYIILTHACVTNFLFQIYPPPPSSLLASAMGSRFELESIYILIPGMDLTMFVQT